MIRSSIAIIFLIFLSAACGFFSYWLLSGKYRGNPQPRVVMEIDSIATRIDMHTVGYKAILRKKSDNTLERDILKIEGGENRPKVGEEVNINHSNYEGGVSIFLGLIMALAAILIFIFMYTNYPYF